eukprot:5484486-Pyramimonas_sp.AAC.1
MPDLGLDAAAAKGGDRSGSGGSGPLDRGAMPMDAAGSAPAQERSGERDPTWLSAGRVAQEGP